MPLLSLPNELLLTIADNLEPRDINLFILTGSRHLLTLLTPYLNRLAGCHPYEPGALFWAAASGNTHIASLLLEVARDITVEEILDETVVYYHQPGKPVEHSLRFVYQDGQFFFYDLFIEGKGFHWAVRNSHYALARLMLDEGCGVEADVEIAYDPTIDPTPQTPLIYSCSTGDTKMVSILISAGASISVKDNRNGQTPLHVAAAAGQLEVVKLLLQKGALLERDTAGLTAIEYAAKHGYEHITRVLLDSVENSFTDSYRRNLLQLAILYGHTPLALQLINTVAVDSRDGNKMTALHHAARCGNSSLVEALLNNGADINACDSLRRTPLHLAVQYGHDAVGVLLSHGADVEKQDKYGRRPLHLACRSGPGLVGLLLERGVELGGLDRFRRTPLHICGKWGNREGWRRLVDGGAVEGQKDWKGRLAGWYIEKERLGRGLKEG